MKNKKLVVGIGLIAAVVVVAAVISVKKKKQVVIDAVRVPLKSSSKPCVEFPIKLGSGTALSPCSNAKVKVLQETLNRLSLPPLAFIDVDGKFGGQTESRLDLLFKTKTLTKEQYDNVLNTHGLI